MSNTTHFPNSNQALNKKTKFDRRASLLCDFQSKDITPCKEFINDPYSYRDGLSSKERRLFDYTVNNAANHDRLFFSHQHVSGKCGVSVSHIKRALDKFRKDGLIISLYRHLTTCYYRLAPVIFSQRIRNTLSSVLPVLAAFFSFSLLGSFPINELQVKKSLYNKRSLRNERIIPRARDFQIQRIKEVKGDDWFEILKMSKDDLKWYRTTTYPFNISTKIVHSDTKKSATAIGADQSIADIIRETARVGDEKHEQRRKLYGKRIERVKVVDESTKRSRSMLQGDILQPIADIVGPFVRIPGLIELAQCPDPIIKLAMQNLPAHFHSCGYHQAFIYIRDACFAECKKRGLDLNRSKMLELKRYWHYKTLPQPTNERPPKPKYAKEIKHISPDYSGFFFDSARKQKQEHDEAMRKQSNPEITIDNEAFLKDLEELGFPKATTKKENHHYENEQPARRSRIF